VKSTDGEKKQIEQGKNLGSRVAPPQRQDPESNQRIDEPLPSINQETRPGYMQEAPLPELSPPAFKDVVWSPKGNSNRLIRTLSGEVPAISDLVADRSGARFAVAHLGASRIKEVTGPHQSDDQVLPNDGRIHALAFSAGSELLYAGGAMAI